jgi:hypothetical protein
MSAKYIGTLGGVWGRSADVFMTDNHGGSVWFETSSGFDLDLEGVISFTEWLNKEVIPRMKEESPSAEVQESDS